MHGILYPSRVNYVISYISSFFVPVEHVAHSSYGKMITDIILRRM